MAHSPLASTDTRRCVMVCPPPTRGTVLDVSGSVQSGCLATGGGLGPVELNTFERKRNLVVFDFDWCVVRKRDTAQSVLTEASVTGP
jgi:hypothetical protein